MQKLVETLRKEGGQFVKIMISGIMDFDRGGLTEESLPDEEDTGVDPYCPRGRIFCYGAYKRFPGGADDPGRGGSIEHGNFCDEDALAALADSPAVWVPTVVTVKNLLGDGRFPENVIQKIWEGQQENLWKAFEIGVENAFLQGAAISGGTIGYYMVRGCWMNTKHFKVSLPGIGQIGRRGSCRGRKYCGRNFKIALKYLLITVQQPEGVGQLYLF